MFLSILTIAIVVAAGVYMVRHLIFSGLVERGWREPLPSPGDEAYQAALQTRFKQERTRVRSALAVTLLWATCCVLSGIFQGYWNPETELIRLGTIVLSTGLLWSVAIRVMVHSARLSEKTAARTFRHHEPSDDEPGDRR